MYMSILRLHLLPMDLVVGVVLVLVSVVVVLSPSEPKVFLDKLWKMVWVSEILNTQILRRF
jgi:hypothetical protein